MTGQLIRLALVAIMLALGDCRRAGEENAASTDAPAPSPAPSTAPSAGPALPVHDVSVTDLDPTYFELGEAPTYTTGHGIVRLTNDTDEAYELADCKSNCGCLAADCPRSRSLAPGESVEIEIRMKTGDESGERMKRMDFVFRHHPPASVVITIQAVSYVEASPTGLGPSSRPTPITFTAIDGTPFRVTSAEPPVVSGLPAEPAAACTVQVDWNAWKRAGRPRLIAFQMDHPLCPEVIIGVRMPPPE